jgi:hypothetical protein
VPSTRRSELTKVVVDGVAPRRNISVIGGMARMGRKLMVNSPDIMTLVAAVTERVICYRKGKEILDQLQIRTRVGPRLSRFKRKLLAIYGERPTPLEPQQFVEMYKGRKRTIYEKALIRFLDLGVLRKHAYLKEFVKAEKVDPDKAPRCISPRDPVYNIGLGRYLKHVEHPIYRAISRLFGQKWVVSKFLNVVEIGEDLHGYWTEFCDPCFVGFDASRFDFHVTVDMLSWEHGIYKSLYRNDKELGRLLRMQLDNVGRGYCKNGKMKFRVKGRRASGDMNTALGNCLITCSIVYEYFQDIGIRFRFIDNGDDCGVILEKEDLVKLDGLSDHFLSFGFRMVIEEPVYNFEEIVFCQMQPVNTGRGWTMVRQVNNAREKDSISLVPLNSEKLMRKWLDAVGQGGLTLCSGVPVMQEFYWAYIRNGLPSNISKALYMHSGAALWGVRLEAKRTQVTTEARVSFYKAFGIDPEMQEYLEQWYSGVTVKYDVTTIDDLVEIPTLPC